MGEGWLKDICDAAFSLGFVRVGVTHAQPFERGGAALTRWLQGGYHGELAYMARHGVRRADPGYVSEGAQSVLVVALPTERVTAPSGDLVGLVARYARGQDYHVVLRKKLDLLAQAVERIVGRKVVARPAVDSAPLLEREAAARAGVGFMGKSTMTIVPGVGTYVLLGELLLDLELPSAVPAAPKCGACTACLDACPTRAFVDAYVLDARKCISYLSIEYRGVIPRELRAPFGTMVFGCDICQEVCPYNHSPKSLPVADELRTQEHLAGPSLQALLFATSGEHKRLVRGTALRRATREQLARNAAVALGNVGDARAVPILARALAEHGSALVRLHAAWALGRYRHTRASAALSEATMGDSDAAVRAEAHWAAAQQAPVRDPLN